MSKNRRRTSSRGGRDQAYPVGYKRPPLATRFQAGASGNPKGRPKNRKNLKTIIKQAMTALISVQEGAKSRRVTKLEGVVLRQMQDALKGNERAAMAVIKMAMQMGVLEDSANNPAETQELSAAEERILEELILREQKDRG